MWIPYSTSQVFPHTAGLFFATSGHPETGALRNKCCEDIGSNVELPSPHSRDACSSKGRHTRRARLPIATLGRVLENDGGSLSNLCAQTLGQHTSNVPEFCFDVPPRTACRCPEPDPPAFADPHCGSRKLASLWRQHISLHTKEEESIAGCWIVSALFRSPRGAVAEGHPGNLACS